MDSIVTLVIVALGALGIGLFLKQPLDLGKLFKSKGPQPPESTYSIEEERTKVKTVNDLLQAKVQAEKERLEGLSRFDLAREFLKLREGEEKHET